MTNYRRNRMAGGTYFFTVTIAEKHLDILVQHVQNLKAAPRNEHQRAPFVNLALVVLPDHLHTVWRLPQGNADYSNRWRRIKAGFSRALPLGERVSTGRATKGERGIWQRRFWEHTVRDDEDLQRHLDYIHFNPVKHKLVSRVSDWPHSTFHEYVRRGVYPPDWDGCDHLLDRKFGE
jgi:putative transposase